MKNNKQSQVNHTDHEKSKRQFLRGLSALMGAAAVSQLTSGNALATAFNYQTAGDSALIKGKLFSQPQMRILHDVCAVVLPKTDTPSAAELDVHGFLDHQLSVCYDKVAQHKALSIVQKINVQSIAHYSLNFIELAIEQKKTLLVALEAEEFGFTAQDKQDFKELKSLLVFGYFTTEVGATQALNYQAVPGGFKGSVSYSTLKKSWGSLAYY